MSTDREAVIGETAGERARTALEAQGQTALPAHLAPLCAGKWALWRWAGLRGAGFPASGVLKLSSAECAIAAEQVLLAEGRTRRARNEAIEEVRQRLNDADSREREIIEKALRRLKKDKLPEPLPDHCSAKAAVDQYLKARAGAEEMWFKYRQTYKAATTEVSNTIRQIAAAERFREAVIWQNRRALHTGIYPLLRKSPETGGSKKRQHEEMVASYLQRYCTKNETIGFFGPVGWARIGCGQERIAVAAGPILLAERNVYFEGWCIDELANSFSQKAGMQPFLIARRMPYIRVEGTTLYQPMEPACQITRQQAAALRSSDGVRTAREVAMELLADASLGLNSEQEVYELLADLRRKRWISLGFELPLVPYPERSLRQRLKGIDQEGLHNEALSAIEEMELRLKRLSEAAGDAEGLDRAMEELEAAFTRLTGNAATRSAGRSYVGRTLVYEDCRRNIEVTIGERMLDELSPALTLILTSARWFTQELARIYREAFDQVYTEMASGQSGKEVDAAEFWFRAQHLVLGRGRCLIDKAVEALQRNWAELLSLEEETVDREIRYKSDELAWKVNGVFEAKSAGWESARYHSPDLMIAASDLDAIKRGECEFVLGELHIGMNTLGSSFFLLQHPSPGELLQAVESDLTRSRIMPVTPKYFPRQTTRTNPSLVSPRDYWLETAPDSPSPDVGRTLRLADLFVERTESGLKIKGRYDRKQYDIIDFFGEMLDLVAASSFKPIKPGRHRPRIKIDNLVLCRESWCLQAEQMGFVYDRDEARRFVEAKRWARAEGIPRHVFVKVPVETKPFYVDFNSPIFVNIFSRMIRKAIANSTAKTIATVSEMLPRPDQAWLPDAENNLYTCEFRFVALDLAN